MRRELDAIRSLQLFFAGVLPEPWDVRLTVEAGTELQRPYALVEQNAAATSDGGPNLQTLTIAYTASLYLPAPASGLRQEADDAALELRERVWQAVKWGPDLRRLTTDRIPLYSYEPRVAVQRVRVRGATGGTWRLDVDGELTAAIAFDAQAPAVQAALDGLLAVGADPVTQVVARGGGVFDVGFVGELAGVDVATMELDTAALVNAPADAGVRVILEGAPAPWRGPADFMRVESFGQTTVRDEDNPALVMVAVDLRCTFARGPRLPFEQMLLQHVCVTAGIGG